MPRQEYPVISLFSGALGLDLGLESAGFRLRVAVECNRFAAATIKRNRPDVELIERRIEEVTTSALAPSLSPGALPGVTLPSFWNAGLSLARPSSVVSFRGASSSATLVVPPFEATSTGTITLTNVNGATSTVAVNGYGRVVEE